MLEETYERERINQFKLGDVVVNKEKPRSIGKIVRLVEVVWRKSELYLPNFYYYAHVQCLSGKINVYHLYWLEPIDVRIARLEKKVNELKAKKGLAEKL